MDKKQREKRNALGKRNNARCERAVEDVITFSLIIRRELRDLRSHLERVYVGLLAELTELERKIKWEEF